MSIQQFASDLKEGRQKSPLLEALRRIQIASLDHLKAWQDEADPEWAIWNQEPPLAPSPAAGG
jgi:hypothetical protein